MAIDPVSGTAAAATGPVGEAAGVADPPGVGEGSAAVVAGTTTGKPAALAAGSDAKIGSGAGGSIDMGAGIAAADTPPTGVMVFWPSAGGLALSRTWKFMGAKSGPVISKDDVLVPATSRSFGAGLLANDASFAGHRPGKPS